MPSIYAHYRMGQEVLPRLPEEIRKTIAAETDLFNIGLHGPDLLFYYRPLEINRINRTGYAMHRRAGKELIAHAASAVRSHYFSGGYFAYACGLICHFALDRQCHSYILEKIASGRVSHAELEMGFDRFLLIRDGFDPAVQNLTEHIRPDYRSARIISAFFPDIKAGHVLKAMKSMKLCSRLLLAPTRARRRIVGSVLELTGNYRYMRGFMMDTRKNPRCTDSSRELYKCYSDAVRDAVVLISEFKDCACGRKEWNELYGFTFGSKLPNE